MRRMKDHKNGATARAVKMVLFISLQLFFIGKCGRYFEVRVSRAEIVACKLIVI